MANVAHAVSDGVGCEQAVWTVEEGKDAARIGEGWIEPLGEFMRLENDRRAVVDGVQWWTGRLGHDRGAQDPGAVR